MIMLTHSMEFKLSGHSDMESEFTRFADALIDLEASVPGMLDSSVWMDAKQRKLGVTITVEDQDQARAESLAFSCIMTAVHVAGGRAVEIPSSEPEQIPWEEVAAARQSELVG
ncbi:hypothetical protein GCM10009569_34660 [Arthrobacter russicus]